MIDDRGFARTLPEGWRFGVFQTADGWPLRRFDWPQLEGVQAKGTILFLVGRADMPEKWLESLRHWHADGWAITGFDWRGQGGSGRLMADPLTGHIDRFETWRDDLAHFVGTGLDGWPGPRVIIAHSMGGHIALRALADCRISIDAAVLLAPMLGIVTAPLPRPIARWLFRLAARVWPERKAWSGMDTPTMNAVRHERLTHDRARFDDELYWREQRPDLLIGAPSFNWLARATDSCDAVAAPGKPESVSLPMLILATEGDALVAADTIRGVAGRIPSATLHLYGKDVAHELLREIDTVRADVLARIDGFLATLRSDK